MDFITRCFREYNSSFTNRLTTAGFTDELSQCFLDNIASSLYTIISSSSLEKTIKILLSDDPSKLLESIDVSILAKNINIDRQRIDAGLEAIAPVMKQVFSQRCNEIVAATASLAWKTTDKHIGSAGNF